MPPRPGMSKAELEIARIVWDLKEAGVRQIYEALPPDRDIDFTTVQTYLRRLEEKGYLKVRLEGRSRVYSPRVRPQTVIRETVTEMVNLLFGGNTLPLMKHLVEDRPFSRSDIEQLRQLLDQLDREPTQGDGDDT
jgi:BlaI family penicillinase repressor